MLFCISLLWIIYDPLQTSKHGNCLYLFFEKYPRATILRMRSLSACGMLNMLLLSWKYDFNILKAFYSLEDNMDGRDLRLLLSYVKGSQRHTSEMVSDTTAECVYVCVCACLDVPSESKRGPLKVRSFLLQLLVVCSDGHQLVLIGGTEFVPWLWVILPVPADMRSSCQSD